MKKITAFLVFCVYLISFMPAYAQTGKIVCQAENYESAYKGSSSWNPGKETSNGKTSLIFLWNGTYRLSYKVNVEKAGYYNLASPLACDVKGDYKLSVLVDGEQQLNADVCISEYSYTYGGFDFYVDKDDSLGEIYLSEGDNTITFVNSSKTFRFDYFTLSYAETNPTCVYFQELSTSTLTEYLKVDAELVTDSKGQYKLTVNASVTGSGIISVSSNGTTVSVMNCYGQTSNYFDNSDYVYLDSGTQKMVITVLSGNVKIKSISIEPVLQNKSLKDAINSAKSYSEVYSVLKECEESFAIDIDSQMAEIYYKEPILLRLLNRNFSSDSEVVNAFLASVKKETQTPTVVFMEGSRKLSSPKSGNLSMIVRTPRINESATIFAGFYDGGRLTKIYKGDYSGGAYITIKLDDLVITETTTFKMVYVNDIDELKPINPENNIHREVFVSTSGDDSFDGTEEKPFKTLKKAKEAASLINSAQTGDIVINIDEGRYFLSETEVFSEKHGGKNGYNIIIRGKAGKTSLSGGINIGKFIKDENGLYSMPFDGKCESLYINGERAQRAKSDFAVEVLNVTENVVKVKRESLGGITDLTGAELFWNCEWTENITPVLSSYADGDFVYITIPKNCVQLGNGTTQTSLSAEKRFYIEDLRCLLNNSGEYYFDETEKKIYYYPYGDEDIENAEVFVPVTEGLISLEGKDSQNKVKNIIFENITFEHGAWNEPRFGFIGNQADRFYDEDGTENSIKSQFSARNCDGLKIKNCVFANLESTAIGLIDGVSNTIISENIIRDIGGSGIVVGTTKHDGLSDGYEPCKNIMISENVIRRTSQKYMSCPAITVFYESGIFVTHNDIRDIPYSGISAGWGWGHRNPKWMVNLDISHNRMDNVMTSLHDGSFVYTLGELRNTAIHDNYLTNCKYINSGVYNDSGSSFISVYRNVILNREGSRWWYLGRNLTKDNTAYENYVTHNIVSMSGENNEHLDTVVLNEGFPKGAEEVVLKAGVSEKNQKLIDEADKACLKRRSNSVIEHILAGKYGVEAEDFSAFGAINRDRITEIDMSVGYLSIAKGEWTEYKINVPSSGKYKIGVVAANGAFEECSISVSSGGKTETVTILPTGSHGAFEKFETGEFTLAGGENTIRIENLSKAFHLDYIYID